MMANSKNIPTPKVIPPIPDSFENVVKALVKPKPKAKPAPKEE